MKNPLLIFNIILLALVGILFYFHFKHHSQTVKVPPPVTKEDTVKKTDLKIAYVDLDSIQEHYTYYKEKMSDFENKKDRADRDLNNTFQKIENERIAFLQKGNNISQIEAENFQKDYTRKMQNLDAQKRNIESEMQEEGIRTMEELKKKINEFLGNYNQSRGYSYIFSYSSSINVLFYKDTTYNITREVISGLNAAYDKTRPKK
jgi:outer membrane protein